MVTNESGISEDWAQLTEWVGDKAKAAGQTVGLVADDIIPGNPETAHELAGHLADLGGGFEKAGEGFKRIDDGGWTGQAADGARAYIETCPPKWLDASDAFTEASKAVADYQRVLAQQQAKAARAKEDLERAEEASDAAREAHNAKVDAFNASDRTGPRPPTFIDPAAGDIAAARRAIEEAKAAVAAADQRAAQVVRAAAERAPAEPGWLAQKAQDLEDAAQTLGRMGGSFATSAGSAVVDLAKLGRMVLPFDPHKILHPADAAAGFSSMAAGVAGAVMDPYAAVKTVVNIDGWREDPAGEMGSFSLDALASLAGGGGVASKLARSVGDLADTGGDLARHADDITPAQPRPDHGLDANGEPYRRVPGQDSFVRPSEMGHTNGHTSPPPDARHSAEPPPMNGRAETQATPAASQPTGWQQPPSTLYGDQHSMVGPREDGGFGPRGSAPDGSPHSLEHQPTQDSRPMPQGIGESPDWGSDSPGADRDALPGHEPGREFEDALRHVEQHGDPVKFGQHSWDGLVGDAEELPKGITRERFSAYGDEAKEFLYRNDPADQPLYRKQPGELADIFEKGISARHPEAPATLENLSAHMGNTGNPTPFISTTDNLGHALSRDGGFRDGVVLDIRSPGGAIDTDATFKNIEGDRFISHGEGEKAIVREVPREHIRGGWGLVDGKPRWFDNPNFDHSIMNRSST